MGYKMSYDEFNLALKELSKTYRVFAPSRIEKKGRFSDTDDIRYLEINNISQVEYKDKSLFSPKDLLFPINEVLFKIDGEKLIAEENKYPKTLIFLRACDLNALKRLDQMFLNNGQVEDTYYKEKRMSSKFILMECASSYENCFCVSMGTNKAEDYSMAMKITDSEIYLDIKDQDFSAIFENFTLDDYEVAFIEENDHKVKLPNIEKITPEIASDPMWLDYDRCIGCGRCNFSCPTCTCFTTSDIYYDENKSQGERRRTWASCHVDGFTNMAGGHSFRQNKGSRMRYKILHKVYSHKKRFGENMCVGCGRCDDRCPEYISYANSINKLTALTEREV